MLAREIVYTDDLDGSHGAEPVRFGWDDVWWELDLAEANKAKLEKALRPFLDQAHPATVAAAKGDAPKRQARSRGTSGIDYSSPEYAGNPHRGRVTEAEATYVREHFDEVNKRLSAEGLRMLDPNDSKVKERYGL
jgi:Lsr2